MQHFSSSRLLRAVALLLVILTAAPGAQATVYYVNGARPDNTGSGLSWTGAKRDVQEALNLATTGDEVWVQAGTYLPTLVPPTTSTTTARDQTFYLIDADVKLYGGFVGTESSADQRNPAANATILSGDLDGSAGTADAYHVLVTLYRTSACVIDGFTVQGGRANGGGTLPIQTSMGSSLTPQRNNGGGMLNNTSNVSVSNCIFTGNIAGNIGGGIIVSNGSLLIAGCTFANNSSVNSGGGGIYINNATLKLSGCIFIGNNSGANGGGLFNNGSTNTTLTNCAFSGNTAAVNGGGMFCGNGTTSTATACTFAGNQATSSSSFGGGVSFGASAGGTLTDCILYGNTTPANAGDVGREEIFKGAATTPLTVGSSIVRDYNATNPNNFYTVAPAGSVYTSDPVFVNSALPTGPDGRFGTADDGLRLGCGSLAVDLGTGTPAADAVGNARRNAPDLGAYESTGGTAPSNTIPAITTTVSAVQTGVALPYTDCENELLQLNAAFPYTLAGSTIATVRVLAATPVFNRQPYVRRYYDISPATSAATATAEVTLYFAQADFDDYNAARGPRPALPTTPADPEGYAANLRISQQHGSSATGAPGTYSGWTGSGPASVLLTPAAVTYNPTATRWEVRFAVTGFSGFFAHTGSAPLPVALIAFTATAQSNTAVRLAWVTASEKNSHAFEVERSLDGKAFERIGTVAAAGSSSSRLTYELFDAQLPSAAGLYYRLKQVDQDGAFSYSPVRLVGLQGAAAGPSLYPNPASGMARLTGALPKTVVMVFDALGRLVATATADAAGTAALALPAGLPAGVYVVRAGSKSLRLAVE